MRYRAGAFAAAAVAVAVPVVGGSLAGPAELLWGGVLLAAIFIFGPVRTYAAAASVGFGWLALARPLASYENRGLVAVALGLSAVVAFAFALGAITRRRRGLNVATGEWVGAALFPAVVLAASAAALIHKPTVNLAFVPVAALTFLGGRAGLPTKPAVVALAAGLALAGARLGVATGLTFAAERNLTHGEYAGALRRAAAAKTLGGGDKATLALLRASAAAGAPWSRLEKIYGERDPRRSARAFDAEMAAAAFARGDYERAALFADLAATPGPAGPNAGAPVSRIEIFNQFMNLNPSPFGKAWALLWHGDAAAAAHIFNTLDDPRAPLMAAYAWERAGKTDAARERYQALWEREPRDLHAAFGLLRTGRLDLRGKIWNELARQYPLPFVGTRLAAADGFRLSKHRLSLGRTPAALIVHGPGRRRVAVIAEAYPAADLYPIVTLAVDGVPTRTFYMNVPGESLYETEIYFPGPRNVLTLNYENDYADADAGMDRNVFIREVRLTYVLGG